MLAAVATAAVLAISSSAHASSTTASATPQKMPTFNGGVYAMAYDGSTLYVGGSFTQVNYGGAKADRAGLAAINASTGALLPWTPTQNGTVSAIAINPTTHGIYLAGTFTTVDGAARGHLAEVSPTGGVGGAFAHTVTGSVNALAVGHGLLYMGGKFTKVDSGVRSNLAAFSLTTNALSSTWAPTTDDVVNGLYSDTSRVYVGGKFHKINGISGTAKLAAVDPASGARIAAFKPSVAVLVYAIGVGPDGVFAAEGGQGGRAIEYSTTGAVKWTFTTDGDIQALAYQAGVLYVGGHYDNACKTASTGLNGFCNDGAIPRVKLAAVDATTGALLPWNPVGNGIHGVFAMASNATLGTVAVGGEFTTIGGVSHGRFVQFH